MPDERQNRVLHGSRQADERAVVLATAEEHLRQHGGYDWLLDAPEKHFWSASEIAAQFQLRGLKVGNDAVLRAA